MQFQKRKSLWHSFAVYLIKILQILEATSQHTTNINCVLTNLQLVRCAGGLFA